MLHDVLPLYLPGDVHTVLDADGHLSPAKCDKRQELPYACGGDLYDSAPATPLGQQ
jgi:hypothetical protein